MRAAPHYQLATRLAIARGVDHAVLDDPIEDLLRRTGRALGPPWQIDHRLAMAAAIVANHERRR